MQKLIIYRERKSKKKKYVTWSLKNEKTIGKQKKRKTIIPQVTLSYTQSPESPSYARTWEKYQNWREEQRFPNCSVHLNYLEFLLKIQTSESHPGYSDLKKKVAFGNLHLSKHPLLLWWSQETDCTLRHVSLNEWFLKCGL